MKKFRQCLLTIFLFPGLCASAQTINKVDPFDKVIVSPHIQVQFVQGEEESVTIEDTKVDPGKIHIEVNNHTLRIYLEGAKEITKNERTRRNGNTTSKPLYYGTQVTAIVTYKTLEALSLRGDETHVCQSPLRGDHFSLKIYGESNVTLTSVDLSELQATIYGDSQLEIQSGSVYEQRYTAYGESTINSLGISSKTSRITAFGESEFRVNVSDQIKLVAFGEARLQYRGDARINKGMHFGEVHISKLD